MNEPSAYVAAFRERRRFEAEISRYPGLEVWGAGLDMQTLTWDISVENLRTGDSVTLSGPEQAQRFLDNWITSQEWPEGHQ